MAVDVTRKRILAVAAAWTVLVSVIALWPYGVTPRPGGRSPVATIAPASVAAVAGVYERDLFSPAGGAADAPADAPALLGIAGRLNRDAVALVRVADGGSRSLSVGDSVDGWRLESLAIDAAFFTRGRERVRVGMATPEDAPPEPDQ